MFNNFVSGLAKLTAQFFSMAPSIPSGPAALPELIFLRSICTYKDLTRENINPETYLHCPSHCQYHNNELD